jgi:mRNA interferase MazF
VDIARGEVWWYEHPETGRRPHLILTRNTAISVLNQVLGVPTTRTRRGIPTEVALDESDGMPQPCVLTVDNVGLVRTALLIERIATLGPDRMDEVCRALAYATGCRPRS